MNITHIVHSPPLMQVTPNECQNNAQGASYIVKCSGGGGSIQFCSDTACKSCIGPNNFQNNQVSAMLKSDHCRRPMYSAALTARGISSKSSIYRLLVYRYIGCIASLPSNGPAVHRAGRIWSSRARWRGVRDSGVPQRCPACARLSSPVHWRGWLGGPDRKRHSAGRSGGCCRHVISYVSYQQLARARSIVSKTHVYIYYCRPRHVRARAHTGTRAPIYGCSELVTIYDERTCIYACAAAIGNIYI